MAALDALILMPQFCNNYLLSAPYFQEKPGTRSNNMQILFYGTRQTELFGAINANPNLRMQIAIADNDCFRNSCYALCFFLRGNMRNVQILAIEGDHTESLRKIVGTRRHTSRIKEAAKQVDTELYQNHNLVGENFRNR